MMSVVYEENSSVDPSALNCVTNKSGSKNSNGADNPFTCGKSCDVVVPATQTLPVPSTPIPNPRSPDEPPRYVEKTIADPAGLILVTNASRLPPDLACVAPTVGKSVEVVEPVIYAF